MNFNYGIYLGAQSENNEVYHNAIINNAFQAFDIGTNNKWDNGYPSGGNYWSDHIGPDDFSGADQSGQGRSKSSFSQRLLRSGSAEILVA